MKSWNSVHNLAVPGLVAFIEAGWAWAWFSAVANLAHGVPADLPFLALVIPAVVAVGFSGVVSRIPKGWPIRGLVLAPVAVVTAAISAAVIGSLYEHGSFSVLALHPWTMTGRVPAAEGAVAWIAAIIAVARGCWLGFEEITLTHAIRSIQISGFAYLLFFVVASVHHAPGTFHPYVGVAGTLVVISFPAALSVVAIVNERNLERSVLHEERVRPSLAWLGAVLVPMSIIGVVGAVLALAVGPLSGPIGHAIRRVILLFAGWLDDLAKKFEHATRAKPKVLPRHPGSGPILHGKVPSPHLPLWATLVTTVIGIAVTVLFAYVAARSVSFIRNRRQLVEVESELVTEEKESVFSWTHVFEQLRELLARLFRRNRGAPDARAEERAAAGLPPDHESVRRQYLRVLVAARAAGYGRGVAETTLEHQSRLADVAGDDGLVALEAVRTEYEVVRYGEGVDSGERLERVRQHAEVVVALLEDSREETEAERVRTSAAAWAGRRPPAGAV